MLTEQQIIKVVATEYGSSLQSVELPVGVHTIDAIVEIHISGAVEQKPAQLYTPTAHIPVIDSMAALAEIAGNELYQRIMADHPRTGSRRASQLRLAVRNRMLRHVQSAAESALNRGERVSEWLECSKDALRAVTDKVTAKLPRERRKGQLRRTVSVSGTVRKTEQRETA